jgi:hypothetical protein
MIFSSCGKLHKAREPDNSTCRTGATPQHYPADGQSHHIIEIAFDALDAYNTDPFLYRIGARFVIRLVLVNIVFDLRWLRGWNQTAVRS